MSKTETDSQQELPTCHFCGRSEWREGNKIKTPYSNDTFFVCFDCGGLFSAYFDNYIAGLLENLSFKDNLKCWDSEETPAK